MGLEMTAEKVGEVWERERRRSDRSNALPTPKKKKKPDS